MENSKTEDHNSPFNPTLRYFLIEGIASQVMFTLLAIPFISLYLASIGASPSLIGLVAAIPYASNLIQLPSALFAEKFNRKKFSISASTVSRFSLLIMALFLLFDEKNALLSFVILFILYNIFKEVSSVAWNSWMRDLIPMHIRGEIYSKRLAYGKLAALVVVLLFIFVFNFLNKLAFSLLFITAFLAGIISLFFIKRIEYVKVEKKYRGFKNILNGNFLKLLIPLSLWKFATKMSLPFFSVYTVSVLKYPSWVVISLISLSQISSIYFLRISGKIMDKFGNKPVTILAFLSFSLAAFLFTFTTMPERHVLTPLLLTVIYILDGFYSSIPTITLINMIAKITPKGNSASCYALNSTTMSLCGAAGSIVGGVVASMLLSANLAIKIDIESSLGLIKIPVVCFVNYDFLFITSSLLSLLAAKLLRYFKEEGETQEKVVKKEIKNALIHDVQSLVAYTMIYPKRFNLLSQGVSFRKGKEKLQHNYTYAKK